MRFLYTVEKCVVFIENDMSYLEFHLSAVLKTLVIPLF